MTILTKRKYITSIMLAFVLILSLVQAALADDPAPITVNLQNSDGTLLTGGSLRYHDGSWQDATDNGDGTFTVTTSAAQVTYEMTYNNGRQTMSNIPVTSSMTTKSGSCTMSVNVRSLK